jgi:hypothetical protein
MDKIEIRTKHDGFDCECCGWCDMSSFTVTYDSITHTFEHDGHFGGAEWDGDEDSKMLFAIAVIYEVESVYIDTDEYSHCIGSGICISLVVTSVKSLYGSTYMHIAEIKSPDGDILHTVEYDVENEYVDYDAGLIFDSVCRSKGIEVLYVHERD